MIAIITDSTWDIPDELIETHGIFVVPQYIIWGEQQYRDGTVLISSRSSFMSGWKRKPKGQPQPRPVPVIFWNQSKRRWNRVPPKPRS